MPHVFTHAEYADMVFVYGFCNGNALAAFREYMYSLRFTNCRVPKSRVFASVYNKLRETGALPSIHISSERANEQNVGEVESIFQSVECRMKLTKNFYTYRCSTYKSMANFTSARSVSFSSTDGATP